MKRIDKFTGMLIHYCVCTSEHKRFYACECPLCAKRDILTKPQMKEHMKNCTKERKN